MKKVTDIISKINVLIDELTAYVATVRTNNEPLCQEVDNASNAYFADVTVRENRIKEQIADLKNRKQAISNTLEDMRPHFVNATTEGDKDKIEELQKHMADLKAEEAALNTQIEFLYTTPITGNQELFNAATELNNKLKKNSEDFRVVYRSLIKIAEYWQRVWEKLYEEFLYNDNPGAFSDEYSKILEYHNNAGKCIEKSDKKAVTPNSEPINLETNRYTFGKDPEYKIQNKSTGPRI